jgi:hypothetical protein
MVDQAPVTVHAALLDGHAAAVRSLLQELRAHGPGDERLPLAALPEVHFARLFLLEETTDLTGVPIPAALVYMADVDGSGPRHLRALVARSGPALDAIWTHCADYPAGGTDRDRRDWLHSHCVTPAAYYVHRVGRTAAQIRAEAGLRAELEDLADAGADPVAVRRRPELRWVLRPTGPGPVRRLRDAAHLAAGVALGIVALPVALPVAAAGLLAIRRRERTDRPDTDPPDPAHVREVERYEDFAAQNPFTAVGLIKPGRLRRTTMRVALAGLDFGCRHLFARDNLAGVRTIHFARWLSLDDGRRVVFASSYDGSQESYMDDFIDRLHWGVNLVFSNGVGYPRTRWLIQGGARDETAYKHYLRRHQVPTAVFYSAYDRLPARTVDDNQRLREGLRAGTDWRGLL